MQDLNRLPVLVSLSVAVFLLFAGCNSVKHTQQLDTKTNSWAMAGMGDTVLSVTSNRSLISSNGKADIFGRKKVTGQSSVRFVGSDGKHAYFVRQATGIETGPVFSGQTPLAISGKPAALPNSSVDNINVGSISTSGQSPAMAFQNTSPQTFANNGIEQVAVPFHQGSFIAGEYRIEIQRVTQNQIRYRVVPLR